MSTKRVSDSGWFDRRTAPRGPNGRILCRECGTEVPKGRITFCSDACVTALSIRNSPSVVRWHVEQRDQGICSECGKDCKALERQLAQLQRGVWQGAVGDRLRAKGEIAALREAHGVPDHRTTFWDADHIVPVIEGGGECDLANYRTLCIPCHRSATAALHKRLAKRRRECAAEASPQTDLLRNVSVKIGAPLAGDTEPGTEGETV